MTSTRDMLQRKCCGNRSLASTWLPVLVGICAIAFESTGTLSGEHTSHFLRPIFTRVLGPMSDAHWDTLHMLLRKCGHFAGYGTLGLLWLRAWLRTLAAQSEWTLAAWRTRAAMLGVVGTFLTASADEYHQTFLPSRTGQFSDVLIDTGGALLFILIVAVRWSRRAA
ncbi:MAG TPA: VanZ family protein [Acidobacteriaceae bacterium]